MRLVSADNVCYIMRLGRTPVVFYPGLNNGPVWTQAAGDFRR